MKEEVVIWCFSFLITLILSNLNLKERLLSNLVGKLKRNRGITRIKKKATVKTQDQFFLSTNQDIDTNLEEEKEFILIRLYNQALETIEGYKRSLRRKLSKAGVRNDKSLQDAFMTTIALTLIFAVIAYIYIGSQYKDIFNLPLGEVFLAMFSLVFGFCVAVKIIDKFIEKAADERRNTIEVGIPDLLDLMVICSEAGFDIQKILQRTADEIALSHKTLSDELQRTNAEFKLSSDFYTIFKNLEERTESMKFQSICNIMVQSIEMGSSLTDALKVLAHQIRDERSFKAEDQAGKIPNKIMMPLLLFIMPTLFIVILAPMLLKASDAYS